MSMKIRLPVVAYNCLPNGGNSSYRLELKLDNFEHLQLVEDTLGLKFKEF